MKTKVSYLIAIGLLTIMYSCYPGGAEYVDELDTSISKYSPDYFDEPLTGKYYYLPDEILHIKDGEEVEDPDRTHDDAILAQVNQHLLDLGMQEAVAGIDTSIAIAISAIEQNNSGAAWIPGGGWWGGWYPWYPGWGWGGYYPWYPVYYNYKTGSVLIEMADYELKETEEPPLIYFGALDGLLQGSDAYIGDRLERGIDELFSQAPF
ncbi:DUF4136 domain-containing protein [Carboxylicivirga marina]|uniref:DUF4136 domain-containing protein n=1 Tax=Carboxylicivirga marina TaxID=2800988 RepID=A0ABS1HJA1_9BACT|nr:DUF4136 domain-containing protein [Carboxylicivirga marina]MBK3517627.1 DUF4136 domain-containing protein [Carboxylicivirga marina]